MRKYWYTVSFENEHVEAIDIYACSKGEAKILAQAKKIEEGLDYRVKSILKIPDTH